MSLRIISQEFLSGLVTQAAASPRLRTNFNFHETADSVVQRLIVQLCRGTYIRPHRHFELNKWEMTLVLAGEVDILTFDDDGTVSDRLRLSPGAERIGLELPAQTWHSYVPLSDQVTFFEIKEGPYDAARMSQFASWAPAEGEANVNDYLTWMSQASIGQRYA